MLFECLNLELILSVGRSGTFTKQLVVIMAFFVCKSNREMSVRALDFPFFSALQVFYKSKETP